MNIYTGYALANATRQEAEEAVQEGIRCQINAIGIEESLRGGLEEFKARTLFHHAEVLRILADLYEKVGELDRDFGR